MNMSLINTIVEEATQEFKKGQGQLRYGQCIFNAARNNCVLDTEKIVNMNIDCFYDDRKVEAFLHYIGENF